MINSSEKLQSKKITSQALILVLTVTIIIFAFLLGSSSINQILKFTLLIFLAATQSIIFIYFIKLPQNALTEIDRNEEDKKTVSSEGLDKIYALREAELIFGSALRTNDLFDFICRRLENVFEFSNAVLILAQSEKDLKIQAAHGSQGARFVEAGKVSQTGIAGKVWVSGRPEIDHGLELERRAWGENILNDLNIAVAVPLCEQDGNVLGALVLYGDKPSAFGEYNLESLQILSQTISPLFESSLRRERNMESALTDAVTMLPNERAFYLILENQLADSQRNRESRPLTVLAIDLAILDETAGNANAVSTRSEILQRAAETLKEQLREMDFVARVGINEFAVILPTATAETAQTVIERINHAAAQKTLETSDRDEIAFNSGAATFYQDGETGAELYQMALVRKEQAKKGTNSVIWFSKK